MPSLLGMNPDWSYSSGKHNISRSDVTYVLTNPTFVLRLDSHADPFLEGGFVTLYIGFQHSQTEREIEVLMRSFDDPNRRNKIFHVMPLTSAYRALRDEMNNQ